jgi:hypothetical protein
MEGRSMPDPVHAPGPDSAVPPERSARLKDLLEKYARNMADDWERAEYIHPDHRYLLVERSTDDRRVHWLCTFKTRADASDYRDLWERPEDWEVRVLIDLDTNERYRQVITTRWTTDQ